MECSLLVEDVERRLGEVLHRLRAQTPQSRGQDAAAAEVDLTRFERNGDTLLPRAVITLRSAGCGWAHRGGGCTMCGHFAGRGPLEAGNAEQQIAQFDAAFAQVDWSGFPILCLYNGGSLLNPAELPEKSSGAHPFAHRRRAGNPRRGGRNPRPIRDRRAAFYPGSLLERAPPDGGDGPGKRQRRGAPPLRAQGFLPKRLQKCLPSGAALRALAPLRADQAPPG